MSLIKGTLIIMNDGERIFVEHSKDQINRAIDEALSIGRKFITIEHLDRDIYFNYIADKQSRNHYIALPCPNREKNIAEGRRIKELVNEKWKTLPKNERKEISDQCIKKIGDDNPRYKNKLSSPFFRPLIQLKITQLMRKKFNIN